jgi:phosphate transport system substrate-binding protein
MRRATTALGGVLFLAALVGGCQKPERSTRNLVLAGSRTLAPLMEDVGRRFEEKHTGVHVYVQPASVDRALADTRTGLADVGMLGRRLRPDEVGLFGYPVARDGVAFIVHRDNPVRKLTSTQLVALFTGAITNWNEVGGPDHPVSLVRPADAMALPQVFRDYFHLQPNQIPPAPSGVGSCDQIIQAVAEHPYAIGYTSLGCAEMAAARLPIRLLPLGDGAPSLAQMQIGRYPFTRPLLLLTREPPAGLVREFIDYARSAEVHDLVQKHGFVPVKADQGPDR